MAPSQGRHNRGREVLPYCCQSRSSTEHMKGCIPAFMGQGGCTSLCSAVNSCTPLQGLITQVSLEIPATKTPGGRGAGGKKNQVQCVPCVCRAPPQIIILKNIFTGKNLFHSFIKDVPRYIFQCGVIAEVPPERQPPHRERLCYRQAAVFKDTQVTAFMNFHLCAYCFHQLFYLHSSTYFSFKQQVWPDWMIPNLSCLYKTHGRTQCFPIIFYYPSSKRIKIWICWCVHAPCHLGQTSIQVMK